MISKKREIYQTRKAAKARLVELRDSVPSTRGENRGGGLHVVVAPNWDGEGDVPIGWLGIPGVKKVGQAFEVVSFEDEDDQAQKKEIEKDDARNDDGKQVMRN